MTFFSKRKRKNDDPPRFPAWIIVVFAIGFVIAVVLIAQSRPVGSVTNSETYSFPTTDIDLTGTYIIQQATAMAQGASQPGQSSNTLDPIEITATFIIGQATAAAQEASQPAQISTLDPLELTATYFVQQATAIAQGTPQPGS